MLDLSNSMRYIELSGGLMIKSFEFELSDGTQTMVEVDFSCRRYKDPAVIEDIRVLKWCDKDKKWLDLDQESLNIVDHTKIEKEANDLADELAHDAYQDYMNGAEDNLGDR